MPENRIRLGPFAMQLLQEYCKEDAKMDGKNLDEMLIAAFANGTALRPGIANELSEAVSELPDWKEYQDELIARVYSGVDGIGNESIEAFENLNKRIDALEKDMSLTIKNTVALGNMIKRLNKEPEPVKKVTEAKPKARRFDDFLPPRINLNQQDDDIPF